MRGCDVLSTNLENAGAGALSVSEQDSEVQIVGKNDSLIVSRIAGLPHPQRWDGLSQTSASHQIHFAARAKPTLATGSCPRGASRRTKRQLQFFGAPRGIRQRIPDVLLRQIGI